jgi:uncharacterized membrane protein YphA (DoxX/SURF4 family)
MRFISFVLRFKHIAFIARAILGGAFIYASIDKIASPNDFARVVINYDILPAQFAIYFSFLLPWIELFLGIFLLIGLFMRESAFLLSSLLLVFMAAMIIKSINGGIHSCGCFSLNPIKNSSIYFLILRDVLFLACGLFLILQNRKRTNSPINIE